jgi:hypothetical protein
MRVKAVKAAHPPHPPHLPQQTLPKLALSPESAGIASADWAKSSLSSVKI